MPNTPLSWIEQAEARENQPSTLYGLYMLNASGHALAGLSLAAESDEAAIGVVDAFFRADPKYAEVELWHGSHLVHRGTAARLRPAAPRVDH